MQIIGLLLVGSLVAVSMAHPHMPGYYGHQRPAYYNPYYNPYYSPMMGNRAPMDYYNPMMSPYSLPVANKRYFRPYYQPFMVLYLKPLNKPSNLDQNKEQQPEYQMRQDGNAGQQDAPIPGAYIVPANVNGAFGGPLAVTSANQGSSAELGTQYFPLEAAENKPALERILASLAHPSQQQPHAGPYYPAQESDYYAQQRYPYDDQF